MSRELKEINLVDVHTLSLITTTTETKFVALSYVWGSVPLFKTQSSNIHLLRRPGSLSGSTPGIIIPDTIRDAIHLTRELGEKYIWVDCLCIVQDGHSMDQSLKAMAAIYASAELTIVDAAGENANHGLRGIGGPAQERTIEAPTRYMNSQESRDGYPWESKWASRGWTFQESLFSRRLLIFHGLVSWVCGRCVWLEEEPDSPQIDRTGGELPERDHLGVPMGMMSILPELPNLGRWGNIVETFSTRSLTYEEDSVNAFAGATEIMSATFPGGILHGLPELFFDLALLWQPDELLLRRSFDEHVTDHVFPSWSWSGWIGAVDCLAAWYPFKAGLYRESEHYADWVPVVELSPSAEWYKISTRTSQPVAIRNDFYNYEAFRNSATRDLPPGWHRHEHKDGVYFTHETIRPGYKYSYPVPSLIQEENIDADSFGPVLRCVAPRAFAIFGELKDDASGSVVELFGPAKRSLGSLRIHNVRQTSVSSGEVCELIAISKGTVKEPKLMQSELYSDSPLEWAIKDWETDSAEPDGHDVFYNVIWIGWNRDIAYRKGLGKVGRSAWESLQPIVVGIKLG
jgi:hypothetical protein